MHRFGTDPRHQHTAVGFMVRLANAKTLKIGRASVYQALTG
jgi:hypothetical protein